MFLSAPNMQLLTTHQIFINSGMTLCTTADPTQSRGYMKYHIY